MLDSYTIRKIVPRLALAVIGVNLSIYLCLAAVDVTNIIGGGLGDLIRTPFVDSGSFGSIGIEKNALNGIVGAVGAGLMAAIVTAVVALGLTASFIIVGLGMLLLASAVVVLVAIAVLATLVLRYGAIIFLSIVSPIAIACLVLPGTEKYFKTWWDFYLKTLIVYPIIAAIFAISDVLGAIFLSTQASVNNLSSLVSIFVVLAAMYAPLFMIPFSFKMAGGFLGNFYDFLNTQGVNRVREKLNKWKEDPESWYAQNKQRLHDQRYEKGFTAKQIASGTIAGGRSFMRGQGFRAAYGGKSRALGAQKILAAAKQAQEREIMATIQGDDDIGEALYAGGSRQEIANALMKANSTRFGDINDPSKHTAEQLREREEAIALVQNAQGMMGNSVRKFVAGHEIASSTTGFNKAGGVELFQKAQGVGDSEMLRMRSMIDMKGEQKKLNRLDSGGYSTSKALNLRKEYAAGTGDFAGLNQAQRDTLLEEKLLDSAIEKNSPSALATMDHNGMKRVSQRIGHRLNQARMIEDPEERAKAIELETAHLAALRDALNYASNENRTDLVDDVYSTSVEGMSIQVKKRDELGNVMKDAEGNEIMETRAPNVRELVQLMDSGKGLFSTYDDAHRGYGSSELDERHRMDDIMRPPGG